MIVTANVPVPQTCHAKTKDDLEDGYAQRPTRNPDALTTGEASDGRLQPVLRNLAKLRDATQILARATLQFQTAKTQDDKDLANAMADLAVTGRAAFATFRKAFGGINADQQDAAVAAAAAAQGNVAVSDALRTAAAAALDRAFLVVHALRDSPQHRAKLRPGIGWIAVSGEDDPPHRPVNAPSALFDQYDHDVQVRYPFQDGSLHTVTTRLVIAPSNWQALDSTPETLDRPTLRALPSEPLPSGPLPALFPGDKVLLFIHGHMSSAEEVLALLPYLRDTGNAAGVPVTVIAFDLPTMGFATRFFHQDIAVLNESKTAPLLDFTEQFILDFVAALDARLAGNLYARIAAVIGGSLGGHMGLRLAMRSKTDFPWLRKIAAWSPASVWDTFADGSLAKSILALGGARGNIKPIVKPGDEEDQAIRQAYFNAVYQQGLGVDPPQPQMWYGSHWDPCKDRNIYQSRLARREAYDSLSRQWHWRIGYEMLVYSFTDFDTTQPQFRRYLLATSILLLAAGQDDNFNFANIYSATQKIAALMVNTPGQTLFLENTGHSIHDEQPAILANGIFALILDERISPLDPEGRVFREPCTWPEQVDCSLGQFDPGVPLKLHWVAPGLVDPGCEAPPLTSISTFPVSSFPISSGPGQTRRS